MDDLVCEICQKPFVSQGMHCRVSTYTKDGRRREEGLSCGAKRERKEERKLSTAKKSDTHSPGYTS
jgi:hypothetical protein